MAKRLNAIGNCGAGTLLTALSALLIFSTALPLSAEAALPSEVSAQLERAQDVAEIWKAVGATAPGIYRRDAWVFSSVVVTEELGETHEHFKTRAEAEALHQLLETYVDQHYVGDSMAVRLTRAYLKAQKPGQQIKPLTFKGHVIVSDCVDKTCRVVFAAPVASVDVKPTTSEKLNQQQAAKEAFVQNPLAYPEILETLGAPEAALLAQLRGVPSAYANVLKPVVPSQAKAMADFLQARSARFEKLLEGASSGDASQAKQMDKAKLQVLVARAGESGNAGKAFTGLLASRGIALLSWHTTRPVLRQVVAAQGFVVMDERLEARSPAVMASVKGKFAQGADLPLVIAALESATEVAPRNAEVWEYLAAAYLAAGQQNEAHICARVWFLLSDKPVDPLKYLLTKFDAGEEARRLAELL